MRFAADGTAFTGELSERNTKFILCNSFFLRRLFVESFPQTSDLAVQLEALDATTIESVSECKGAFEKFISLAGNEK
jgi:hypothetical protein